MNLSDHQKEAVNAGLVKHASWKRVTMPETPEYFPVGIVGMTVEKYPEYSNSWDYTVFVPRVPILSDFIFTHDPVQRTYTARDLLTGLVLCYNTGAPVLEPDGVWRTAKSEGMGGRPTTITLDDTRKVLLRGFWLGSSNQQLRSVKIKGKDALGTAYDGFFLRNEDFCNAARVFLPDYDIVVTKEDGWQRVQLTEKGQPPKGFFPDMELK